MTRWNQYLSYIQVRILRYLLFLNVVNTTFFSVYSQVKLDSSVHFGSQSDLYTPDIHSIHPIGIFFSKASQHFRQNPVQSKQLKIQIGSGNVWLPSVTGFIPVNTSDRNSIEKLPWHEREFEFNPMEIPSEKIQFQADGVIKSLAVSLAVPLSLNWDWNLKVKSYLLTRGKVPFTLLTNDSFIEWVHTNLVADEDPFARKYYGLDMAGIHYVDENSASIEWDNGTILLPGIESQMNYYPSLDYFNKLGLSLNIGILAGFNLSRFNPSFDMGASINMIQEVVVHNQRKIYFGGGYSLLKPGLVSFGNRVNIYNVDLLHGFEGQISFQFSLKSDRLLQLGVHYSYRSPFRKKKEFDYLILSGDRISTHWHYALSHLYKPFHTGSVIVSLFKKNTISIYIREDLIANNAPDLQTGIGWVIPIQK